MFSPPLGIQPLNEVAVTQVDARQPLSGIDEKVRALRKNLHSPTYQQLLENEEVSFVLSFVVPVVGKPFSGYTGAVCRYWLHTWSSPYSPSNPLSDPSPYSSPEHDPANISNSAPHNQR